MRQRVVFRRGCSESWRCSTSTNPRVTPLPMICGLGLGFLLPDRVLEFARARPCPTAAQRDPAGAGSDGAGHGGRSGAGSIHRRRQPRLEAHYPDLSAEFAQLYMELRTGSTPRRLVPRPGCAQQGTGTAQAIEPADRQRPLWRQHRPGAAFARQISAHAVSPASPGEGPKSRREADLSGLLPDFPVRAAGDARPSLHHDVPAVEQLAAIARA